MITLFQRQTNSYITVRKNDFMARLPLIAKQDKDVYNLLKAIVHEQELRHKTTYDNMTQEELIHEVLRSNNPLAQALINVLGV